MNDDFDINKFVTRNGKRIAVDTVPSKSAPKKKRRRLQSPDQTYACIPHELGLRLVKHMTPAMFAVLIELDRSIFEAYGQNPIPLTNHNLRRVGVLRKDKGRALRKLEELGVISVQWNGLNAPLVTHNWLQITNTPQAQDVRSEVQPTA